MNRSKVSPVVWVAAWLVDTRAGRRVCVVLSVLALPLTIPMTGIQVGWRNVPGFLRHAIREWRRDWVKR